MGTLARTAARMRSQPRNRISAIAAKPHVHMPRMAKGVQSLRAGVEVDKRGLGKRLCDLLRRQRRWPASRPSSGRPASIAGGSRGGSQGPGAVRTGSRTSTTRSTITNTVLARGSCAGRSSAAPLRLRTTSIARDGWSFVFPTVLYLNLLFRSSTVKGNLFLRG